MSVPTGPEASYFAARALHKRFGGIVAVEDLSVELRRGELVGLIGPNGSGKTTTINLVAGALKPDSGSITLEGARMSGMPAYAFARVGVARTFQVPRLFKRMTVIENLIVPALTSPRSSRKEAEARAREVLAFLRLEQLAHAFARTLSGGQQKLLELGRALMLRPSLLLLDEPFAGVHPLLLEQIAGQIRSLNAEGYTIVLVDHNLDAVRSLVRRMLVMARGRKIADGASEDVLRDPAVIRAYTGTRKALEGPP
ncbi:MAG: ABC transporter ATP-binding protein [SAR324 cluster bacterium]